MQTSIEWLDRAVNRAAEERATLAEWRLFLSDRNVCLHLDGSESVDQVTMPLYALADGIARDWWKLFGGRDREIRLIDHRMGYAVPDIRMRFDGEMFDIAAHQRIYQNPDIRFWAGPSERLRRDMAEIELADFVGRVVARLHVREVDATSLQLRWARVEASRGDPDETAFCQAAGALDRDPYAMDEESTVLIEKAAELFCGEALIEFLAGLPTNTARANEVIKWIAMAETRPRHQSRLPALKGIAGKVAVSAPPRRDERPWALGYRRARAARTELGWAPQQRVPSYKMAAERLGAPYFKVARAVDGLAALRTDTEDGISIHLRKQGSARNAEVSHTFAFARALGDAICFPAEGRFVVNELDHAHRQATGRAFAAEFLAPVEEVVALRAQGRDTARIADEFAVSPVLIDRQLENADRIRTACD